jgi:transcriptional regulator with XRE-family HTH domain
MADQHKRKYLDELKGEALIAAAVIRARSAAKLTQEQLAARIGTTQTAVARLESGKNMPTCRTLQKVADATEQELNVAFHPLGVKTRTRRRPTRRA